MLCADGRCKTLDAAADGYVRGEAAGALLLQSHWQSSGDSQGLPAAWLAVLQGSAVNQDGRSSSLTAPNGPSQQAVLRAALSDAGLRAADVATLQMHGTGMAAGNVSVLLSALAQASSHRRLSRTMCRQQALQA